MCRAEGPKTVDAVLRPHHQAILSDITAGLRAGIYLQ